MYESLVVNEYLSEVFPEGGEYDATRLLPKSPAGRAMARIITSRSNDLVTAYFTYLTNKNEVSSDVCVHAYLVLDTLVTACFTYINPPRS